MQCSLRPNNFISFVWGRQNSLVFTPFCSTSGSVQNNRSPHFHQFYFQQHEEHAILIGAATCSRQHFAINPCSFYLSCAQEPTDFNLPVLLCTWTNSVTSVLVKCRTGGRGIATDTESTLVSSFLPLYLLFMSLVFFCSKASIHKFVGLVGVFRGQGAGAARATCSSAAWAAEGGGANLCTTLKCTHTQCMIAYDHNMKSEFVWYAACDAVKAERLGQGSINRSGTSEFKHCRHDRLTMSVETRIAQCPWLAEATRADQKTLRLVESL